MHSYIPRPDPRKPSGLTLVELLVVIAVIATLAGIFFALVGRAKQSADAAKCMSNLRTTGTFVALLATESEGPLVVYTSQPEKTWFDFLVDKAGASLPAIERACLCPTLKNPASASSFFCYGMVRLKGSSDEFGPQILADGVTYPSGGGYSRITTINFNRVGNSASCAVLADSVGEPGIFPRATQFLFAGLGGETQGGLMHFRHSGKANVFFLDGHIQAMSPREVRSLQTKNPALYNQGPFVYAEEQLTAAGQPSKKSIP